MEDKYAKRNEVVLQWLPMVRAMAWETFKRVRPVLRGVTEQDLMQAGTLGLIRAADRVGKTCEHPGNYFKARIRGAILDELRGEPHCGLRGKRTPLVHVEIKESMHPTFNPYPAYEAKLALETLCKGQRQRSVDVIAGMLSDVTLAVTGRRVGVSESRISQLQKQAFKEMRAAA
jgi:RNA polymerase sigma factor (sigma-70 family)